LLAGTLKVLVKEFKNRNFILEIKAVIFYQVIITPFFIK